MNHSDIAALMKGAAPAIRDFVASAMQPLAERIAQLERELEAARAVDLAGAITQAVDSAVAALPPAQPGRDADMEAVQQMIGEAVADAIAQLAPPAPDAELIRMIIASEVASLPPAEPGKDADPEVVRAMVVEAVAALPPAAPGKDADPSEIARMIEEAVKRLPPAEPGRDAEPPTPDELRAIVAPLIKEAVDALPKAQDGKNVTVEELTPIVADEVARAVAAIPAAKDGEPGKDGKLPVAKAWEDRVHREGDVVTHGGSTWQASRDTGKAPPHEDWTCLAAAGSAGKDADQIEIAGTYDPGKTAAYRRLNVVALNGGAFIAMHDAPGECPGEGWQMITMRGKPGQQGQSIKGDPGKGIKGDAGPGVVSLSADTDGVLTLVNGDGTMVECDLYPLLSKVN